MVNFAWEEAVVETFRAKMMPEIQVARQKRKCTPRSL